MKNESKFIKGLFVYYLIVLIVGTIQIIFASKISISYLEDPLELYYVAIRYILSLAIICFSVLAKKRVLFWFVVIENIANLYFLFFGIFIIINWKISLKMPYEKIVLALSQNSGSYILNCFLVFISVFILFGTIKYHNERL